MATLFFVVDVEAALDHLYGLVRPGGYLVVNYPNERTREWAREHDDEKRVDFSLVADGENVLTRSEIGTLLDAEPRDYWDAVDATDADFVTPEEPVVSVERPAADD